MNLPPPKPLKLVKPEPSSVLTSLLFQLPSALVSDELKQRGRELQALLQQTPKTAPAAWIPIYERTVALVTNLAEYQQTRLAALNTQKARFASPGVAPSGPDDRLRAADRAADAIRACFRESAQEWRHRLTEQQTFLLEKVEPAYKDFHIDATAEGEQHLFAPDPAWSQRLLAFIADLVSNWSRETGAGVYKRLVAKVDPQLDVFRGLGKHVAEPGFERKECVIDAPALELPKEKLEVPGFLSSLGKAARGHLMVASMIAGTLGIVGGAVGLGSSINKSTYLLVLLPVALVLAYFGVRKEHRLTATRIHERAEGLLREKTERAVKEYLGRVRLQLERQALKQLKEAEERWNSWFKTTAEPLLEKTRRSAQVSAAEVAEERERVQSESMRMQSELQRWHTQVMPQLQQRLLELRSEAME